jgi:hypothetical protein
MRSWLTVIPVCFALACSSEAADPATTDAAGRDGQAGAGGASAGGQGGSTGPSATCEPQSWGRKHRFVPVDGQRRAGLASCQGESDDCVIVDTSTCLVWSEPFPRAGQPDLPRPERKAAFADAKRMCEELRFGGWDTWRLPTFDELAATSELVKVEGQASYAPAKTAEDEELTKYFDTVADGDWFWSTTPSENGAWIKIRGAYAWGERSADDLEEVICVASY